jgi:hypothetical protein
VGALYMYKAGQQVLITMADEQSEPWKMGGKELTT